MKFIKSLFKPKNIYFRINMDIIEFPEGWTPKLAILIRNLTEFEKRIIINILRILQRHLERHFVFWMKFEFTRIKFNNDQSILFRSYFELIMIDWTIISSEFTKREIRSEVGKSLWWILYYSFDGYDSMLYSKKVFRNYEAAFEDRRQLYPGILTKLFSTESSQNLNSLKILYILLVVNPLEIDKGNFENQPNELKDHQDFSEMENWFENRLNLLTFGQVFGKSLNHLKSEINKLQFK